MDFGRIVTGGLTLGGSELLRDTGKSGFQASNFGDSAKYDPARYEQSTGAGKDEFVPAQPGEPGAYNLPGMGWVKVQRAYSGADQNINYYRGQAQAGQDFYRGLASDAQQRQAAQANYGQADFGGMQAQQARMQQDQGLGLMRDAAMGNVPSRAELLARRNADDAARNQFAMAGMAGGGPAGALASRNAMGQAATLQRQSGLESAALRADEMARARGDYFGASSALRSSDEAARAESARQAQFQAQLQAQQRAQNDQYGLGLYGLGNQYGLGMQGFGWNAVAEQGANNRYQQGLLSGSHTAADAARSGTSQYNGQNEWGGVDRGVGAMSGVASVAAHKPGG